MEILTFEALSLIAANDFLPEVGDIVEIFYPDGELMVKGTYQGCNETSVLSTIILVDEFGEPNYLTIPFLVNENNQFSMYVYEGIQQ